MFVARPKVGRLHLDFEMWVSQRRAPQSVNLMPSLTIPHLIDSPVLSRLISCQNMTLAQIGDELQHVANGYIYNSVVDGAGLKGSYDFTLSFSSADKILPTVGDAASSTDPNGALSVFDAVNRQLGLKLEKTKRPYPVLVIDHMEETPTAN
jgi:uncharacterized protein (TIGR03435 family)